MDQVSTGFR